MRVEFRYRVEDYEEALVSGVREWRALCRASWVASLLSLAAGLTAAALDPGRPLLYVPVLVLAAAVILAMTWLPRALARRLWRRHPAFHEAWTAEVSEEGLAMRSTLASSEVQWPYFVRVAETPNLFKLYQSSRAFHVLPKRAFGAESQLRQVRDLLRRRVPGNRAP